MSERNDVQGPQAQHQPVLLRQMRQWVQDEIAEWERYATKAREAQALLPTAPGADVATNTIRVCRGLLAALDELDEYRSGRRVAAPSAGRPQRGITDAAVRAGEVPG